MIPHVTLIGQLNKACDVYIHAKSRGTEGIYDDFR